MGRMRWFQKSPLSAELRNELRRAHPKAGDVLAVGTGGRVLAVACTECLAIRREGTDPAWTFVGWHLISQGGWNDPTLSWKDAEGEGDSVQLDDPGRIPEVFQERVQASIVLQQVFDAPGGGHVVVAGRRRLGADEPIVWQVTTLGKARLSNPEVAEFATAMAQQLRADYDL